MDKSFFGSVNIMTESALEVLKKDDIPSEDRELYIGVIAAGVRYYQSSINRMLLGKKDD